MSLVLVTGAGGFVGSAVVRRLVRSDTSLWDGTRVEHVVALLRPGGSEERLDALPRGDGWSVLRVDISDSVSLAEALRRTSPKVVVHAALDARAYDHIEDTLVRPPLETLLDGLRGDPTRRFVHVGSAWVLGAGRSLDESAPIEPRTPYAHNKAREDALLSDIAQAAGVQWINLRLFNLFGRYEKASRLLPTLVSRLAKGQTVELMHGEHVRDFTEIDTAAQAFVDALAADPDACGSVYHVGSGRGTSVWDLALMVAERFGGADLIRSGSSKAYDGDVRVLVADPTRARTALGWQPDLDLEARVRETTEWWLERLPTTPASEVSV